MFVEDEFNSPKLETIQMCFNSCTVKHIAVYPNTEYYSAMKKNKLSIHTALWVGH